MIYVFITLTGEIIGGPFINFGEANEYHDVWCDAGNDQPCTFVDFSKAEMKSEFPKIMGTLYKIADRYYLHQDNEIRVFREDGQRIQEI